MDKSSYIYAGVVILLFFGYTAYDTYDNNRHVEKMAQMRIDSLRAVRAMPPVDTVKVFGTTQKTK